MVHLFSILFIRMASPWHFGQTYKTRCSKQVWNNFFHWKGFPLSLIRNTSYAIQNCHFKHLLALCLCSVVHNCQLFITSKSQLSTLQASELFPPPLPSPPPPPLYQRTGGKRGQQLPFLILLLPAGGKFTFLMYFYSIILYSLFIFTLCRRKQFLMCFLSHIYVNLLVQDGLKNDYFNSATG